ncbi:MAG: hypothetical protein FWF03_08960, partial [Defluviitaleaceae bacterium]|nr:hypothetical protein [Defluviitaleaceae bacterium]
RNPADMLELLQRHELELNQELLRLQQAYSLIHTYCGLIQEGLGANEENVSVKSMAATPIELGPVTDFSSGHFYESFFVFLKQMKDRKINTAYPIGGVYEDIGTFAKNPGQPSRFFSLAPSGRDEKEAGEYLVGYARGYYGNVGDLPDRILAGAKENDIRLAGPVYEIYLHDEISVENPEQYLIQVSAAVRGR